MFILQKFGRSVVLRLLLAILTLIVCCFSFRHCRIYTHAHNCESGLVRQARSAKLYKQVCAKVQEQPTHNDCSSCYFAQDEAATDAELPREANNYSRQVEDEYEYSKSTPLVGLSVLFVRRASGGGSRPESDVQAKAFR